MSKKSGKEQYLDAKYVVENPNKFDYRDVARAREFCDGYEAGQHETVVKRMEFENWVREVVEIDNRLSFLIDGYQTGEIFEWHKWWLEGLTAIEAVNRNHSEYA